MPWLSIQDSVQKTVLSQYNLLPAAAFYHIDQYLRQYR
ncbi:hypothetical protein SPHINGOT1_310020 [Sphingomonas sp. T1]|nr:hypothetical protein SPHINGOT1_310020 [Sphingomonas sp. T1]